jgi:ribonuclease HI
MQAETIALEMAIDKMIEKGTKERNIFIFTDSQALIRAIAKNTVISKTTLKCIQKIKQIGTDNNVTIAWVPGHSNIEGNEIADQLAEEGTEKENIDHEIPKPETTKTTAIKEYENAHQRRLWHEEKGLIHSKMMINGHRKERFSGILKLNRRCLRVVIGILTGHCCLKKFLYIIGKADDNICRLCEGMVESMKHMLTRCTELIQIRKETLGKEFPSENDLKKLKVGQLIKFARESNIFNTFFKDIDNPEE